MAETDDHVRRRTALGLVLLGGSLILVGLVLVVQHRHQIAAVQQTPQKGDAPDSAKLVEIFRNVAYVLALLAVIFAVSMLALRRWSRHFRNRLLRKPRPPTAAEDAWAMHRLPETPESEEPP